MTTPPIISLPPDPPGEPFVWLVLFCVGLMVGLLDYLTKGIAVDEGRWSSLPSIMQGHSWGAIMVGLYLFHVVMFALVDATINDYSGSDNNSTAQNSFVANPIVHPYALEIE